MDPNIIKFLSEHKARLEEINKIYSPELKKQIELQNQMSVAINPVIELQNQISEMMKPTRELKAILGSILRINEDVKMSQNIAKIMNSQAFKIQQDFMFSKEFRDIISDIKIHLKYFPVEKVTSKFKDEISEYIPEESLEEVKETPESIELSSVVDSNTSLSEDEKSGIKYLINLLIIYFLANKYDINSFYEWFIKTFNSPAANALGSFLGFYSFFYNVVSSNKEKMIPQEEDQSKDRESNK